jgi:hypothetical protein
MEHEAVPSTAPHARGADGEGCVSLGDLASRASGGVLDLGGSALTLDGGDTAVSGLCIRNGRLVVPSGGRLLVLKSATNAQSEEVSLQGVHVAGTCVLGDRWAECKERVMHCHALPCNVPCKRDRHMRPLLPPLQLRGHWIGASGGRCPPGDEGVHGEEAAAAPPRPAPLTTACALIEAQVCALMGVRVLCGAHLGRGLHQCLLLHAATMQLPCSCHAATTNTLTHTLAAAFMSASSPNSSRLVMKECTVSCLPRGRHHSQRAHTHTHTHHRSRSRTPPRAATPRRPPAAPRACSCAAAPACTLAL